MKSDYDIDEPVEESRGDDGVFFDEFGEVVES